MARKERDVIIEAEGRDQGKIFALTEMPAFQAEKWAIRAVSLLARNNVDIGEINASAGMQQMAALGMNALMGVTFDEAEPLLDEMLQCVAIRPNPREPQFKRPLMLEDIEEVATFLTLRMEVFKLHTGFSERGGQSKSPDSKTAPQDSSITPTSPQPSVQFSQSARTKRRR